MSHAITWIALLTLSSTATAQSPDSTAQSPTRELVQHLLAQDLGTRKFPFVDVVQASCGKKVLAVDATNPSHQDILNTIAEATQATITEFNRANSPVRKLRRINEASRFFEDLLLKKIDAHPTLRCSIPINNQGKRQRSGYPDLHIIHTSPNGSQTHAYLDPKLFEKKSAASSLRTFYYEPRSRTNKIQHDALHLLLGISHDGNDGAWTFNGWHLCDLSKFEVRLKAEFQASNRDLYRERLIIRSSKK